jgi:hypothetical protein
MTSLTANAAPLCTVSDWNTKAEWEYMPPLVGHQFRNASVADENHATAKANHGGANDNDRDRLRGGGNKLSVH